MTSSNEFWFMVFAICDARNVVQNNGSNLAASANHPRQPYFREWIQNGGEWNSSETAVFLIHVSDLLWSMFRMRKLDDVTEREKKHMNGKRKNSGTKVEEGNSHEHRND